MTKLHIGQKLWLVPTDARHQPRPVTISKTGTKWITFEELPDRANKQTLKLDGGDYASPGQCWLNEHEYFKHCKAAKTWQHIRSYMQDNRRTPAHMTQAIMDQMLALLE